MEWGDLSGRGGGGGGRANALEGKQVVVDPCQPRHTQRGRGRWGAKVGRQSPTLDWKHTPVYSLIFIPPQRRVRQQGAGGERKEALADPENVPEIIPRSWILNLISGLTCHWPDVVSSAVRF